MDLTSVKHRLESNLCPEHHQHPTVTLNDQGFTISCCCDNFKERLVQLATDYLTDDVMDQISDIFK